MTSSLKDPVVHGVPVLQVQIGAGPEVRVGVDVVGRVKLAMQLQVQSLFGGPGHADGVVELAASAELLVGDLK